MHHRHRALRWLPVPFLVLALVAALAACSSTGPAATDQAAAGDLALAAVDDAFAGQAAADGSDMAPAALGGATTAGVAAGQSVEPVIVVRRVDMHRQRRLQSVTIDGTAQPATASVTVWVGIRGKAQILESYPVSGAPVTLLGVKPIAMEGTVTFQLTRGSGGWQLTGVSSAGVSQGADAATVQSVGFDPNPILIGRDDNVATATLDEPVPGDSFFVVARGRYLRPHGVLADDGVPPDAAAGDLTYSGTVWVGAGARAGAHLAFVTALDYSRTIDVSQTSGSFDQPYTDTLQPVLVQLAAQ